MEETFFMTPERLKKEIEYFSEIEEYYTKIGGRLEDLSHVYLFQPAFIEAIDMLIKEKGREEIKSLIQVLERFIENCPYSVEGKEELLWALELWKANPDVSFTKMLNAAKARKNKVHSVLR